MAFRDPGERKMSESVSPPGYGPRRIGLEENFWPVVFVARRG